jgi:hypothetical protein
MCMHVVIRDRWRIGFQAGRASRVCMQQPVRASVRLGVANRDGSDSDPYRYFLIRLELEQGMQPYMHAIDPIITARRQLTRVWLMVRFVGVSESEEAATAFDPLPTTPSCVSIFHYIYWSSHPFCIAARCTYLPRALFSSPILSLNSTMQKEDSPSHQNVGKCMEY